MDCTYREWSSLNCYTKLGLREFEKKEKVDSSRCNSSYPL